MKDARIKTSCTLFKASRAGLAALLLAAACALGGCGKNGGTNSASGALSMAGAPDGPTVAFETIDGPPPPEFDPLGGGLARESKLRRLSIVSRAGASPH